MTNETDLIVEEKDIEFAVVEDENAVHVLPVVDGEVVETPVESIESFNDVEPETEEDETDVEPETEEDETDVQEGSTAMGVVTCTKLNVREKASKDSKVLVIINEKTEVFIDLDESTEAFYKVKVSGFDGYCVKQFIQII